MEVRPDHPRLFITPERLIKLRHYCGIPGYEGAGSHFGALSEPYQWLRNITAGYVLDGDVGIYYLSRYAFFAMVEAGNPFFLNAARSSANVELARWSSSGNPQHEGNLLGRSPDMALFFDWTYNYLTPTQRNAIAPYLVDGTREYIEDPRSKGRGLPWQPISHYNAYPFSIYGEGYADSVAAAGVEEVRHWFVDAFIPVMDELYSSGLVRGYAGVRTAAMIYSAEILLTASGQDHYARSQFLQGVGMGTLARTRNDQVMADGPGKYNIGDATPETVCSILAARYRSGTVQAFASHFAQNPEEAFEGRSAAAIHLLLFHDPTVAATSISTLPLAHDGDKGGMFYMRDRWRMFGGNPETDIHAGFFSGPNLVSGEIGAQNHFIITRGEDPLLIHGADYEENDGYHWFENWFDRTISYNGVTVYDPAETYGSYHGIALDNDGGASNMGDEALGMLHYPEANRPGTAGVHYRGEATRFENTADRCYVRGSDSRLAYRPGKITEWTRDCLYLRPDLFFIFDRVQAADSTWQKSVIFHTVNAPTADGTQTRTAGTTYGGIWESTNSSTFRADRGTSRIFGRTIFPANRKIRRIGGGNASGLGMRQNHKPFATVTYNPSTSYEWFYAGKNHAPSPDNPGESTLYSAAHRDGRNVSNANPAGDWRVEVQPLQPHRREYFLHVFWPTATSSSAMPPSTALTSTQGNAYGALYNGNIIVAFAAIEGVNAATFNVSGLPAVQKFYFAGLTPRAGFKVTRVGTTLTVIPGSDYMASDAGVLAVSLTPMATDVPGGTGSAAPFRIRGIRPNPIVREGSIDLDLATGGPIRLTIHNVLGQQVRVLADEYRGAGNHSFRWNGADDDGRRLAGGVYFCRVEAGGRVENQRLVLLPGD